MLLESILKDYYIYEVKVMMVDILFSGYRHTIEATNIQCEHNALFIGYFTFGHSCIACAICLLNI